METWSSFIIKSYKHDGHLHRMWHENGCVPEGLLHPDHRRESMKVLVNSQTRIQEADGREWTSRIPGVSFFIPDTWYNIVALIEETGIRYYCNLASPPQVSDQLLTYIDYDLDVIRYPDGRIEVVDQEEYEQHAIEYQYPAIVDVKVHRGLEALLERVQRGEAPFQDDLVMYYYQLWEAQRNGGSL